MQIEKRQQQRQQYIHHLFSLRVISAILSVLVGGCVLPLLIEALLWDVHLPARWHHVPASTLVQFPSLFLALIWLLYYLLFALVFSPPPSSWHTEQDYLPSYPISRGWPDEQKGILLAQCYQAFQQALQRYTPAPVTLSFPSLFYYYRSTNTNPQLTLYWYHGNPLIPEHLLSPERLHELMPLLAHLLFFAPPHNIVAPQFEVLAHFPDHTPLTSFLMLTGNFVWLPVAYKQRLLAKTSIRPWHRLREEILQADEFAFWLGQGLHLEHLLRQADEEAKYRGHEDRRIPTLAERIGHVEGLNNKERDAMRALGLTLEEPSLILEKTLVQCERGEYV